MQTFEDLFHAFIAEHVAVRRKPSTVKSYEAIYKLALRPAFGSRDPNTITRRDVSVFVRDQLATGVKGKTVNCRVSVLRACLAWAEGEDFDVTVPTFRKLPEDLPEVRWMTRNEVNRLHAALQEQGDIYADMFLLAVHTGLRNGELRALKWADVNWKGQRHVRVCRAEKDGHIGKPKGGVERMVPLNTFAQVALKRRRHESKDDEWVFGDPLKCTRKMSWGAIDRARKTLGAKYLAIHWHTCRHTFASHLVKQGVHLAVVQGLLGHVDIKLTMRYAHLCPNMVQASTDVLTALHQDLG